MAKKDKYIGAVVTLKDNFTGTLKGVRKEQTAFRKDLQSTKKVLENTYSDKRYKLAVNTREATQKLKEVKNQLKVIGSMGTTTVIRVKDYATSSISKVRDRLLSIQSLALGAAAAVGGTYAAKGLFDKTIGASAQMEMSQTQIRAMARNDKLANDYMNMLSKMAIASPVLSSQDMFTNATGFLSNFKDTKNLEKAWKITEKLQAINPMENTEGAQYALRNLFSGDATSIIDRFNLDKNVFNEIKKLKPEKQLEAIDKYFTKLGYTNEFVAKSASTAIGQWNQIKEKVDVGLMNMGIKGLENIKPQIEKFNQWLDGKAAKDIVQFGSDMIGGLTDGAIKGFYKVKDYLDTHFLDNEQFKNLDVKSKVKFVLDDLLKTYNDWYESGGKTQIGTVGGNLVSALASSIEVGAPALASAAMAVGRTIGTGVIDGFKNEINSHPFLATLIAAGGAAMFTPGPLPVKVASAAVAVGATGGQYLVNKIMQNKEERLHKAETARDKILNSTGTKEKPVFGGDASFFSPSDHKINVRKEVGNNAKGTPYWRGGLTWVGEQGPELVNLPSGSQIHSNQQSIQMDQSSGNPITININGYNKSTYEIINELIPPLKQVLSNM